MRSHAITKVSQRFVFVFLFPTSKYSRYNNNTKCSNTARSSLVLHRPSAKCPTSCLVTNAAPSAFPSPQPCLYSPPPHSLIPLPMFRYLLPSPPSSSPLPDNSRLVSLRLLSLHRRPSHLIPRLLSRLFPHATPSVHPSQLCASALNAYAVQRECALAGGSARHNWPLADEQQFHAADIMLETGATHQIRVQVRAVALEQLWRVWH